MTHHDGQEGAAAAARRERVTAIVAAAGRIAHDLNNQLTVLLGALDMALLEGGPGSRTTLTQARRAAERIIKLVNALQRLSADRTPAPRPVDLVAEVQRAADRISRWRGEGVKVTVSAAAQALPVITDPDLLEDALVNVLANAGRAVVRKGSIDIVIESDEDRWHITISDDGPGIDPALVDRVFDPLATTRRLPGAGLGLSHALLSLAALEGDVVVAAREGRGTVVTLSAPYLAAGAVVPTRAPAVLVRGTGRVLVVDDSPVALMEAHAILAGAGYEVMLARGHGRALDRLAEGFRPDLVIAESVLFEGGAPELLDWLEQREQSVPMLASVFEGESSPAEADRYAAVVTKPFDAHSLTATAAETLTR